MRPGAGHWLNHMPMSDHNLWVSIKGRFTCFLLVYFLHRKKNGK